MKIMPYLIGAIIGLLAYNVLPVNIKNMIANLIMGTNRPTFNTNTASTSNNATNTNSQTT